MTIRRDELPGITRMYVPRSGIVPGTPITLELLKALDACYYQRRKFKAEWPNGTTLRRKNLLRAADIGMDLNWFAGRLGIGHSSQTMGAYRSIVTHHGPGIRAKELEYRRVWARRIWERIR